MKIAVIGSGISGLSAAWLLSKAHHVTLYEKDDRLGGHSNTQSVSVDGERVDVDTGFIVYNERTYPNLTAFFDHMGVATDASDMSFAISAQQGAYEYSGCGFNGLFAQRKNLFSLRFWSMLKDIKRFYDNAAADAERLPPDYTLRSYLNEQRYSEGFIHDHLIPMGAAIWSMPAERMMAFPFQSFIGFCQNHGLIQFRDRPKWRTVAGGSKNYVSKIAEEISGSIELNTAITQLNRLPGFVEIVDRNGDSQRYDHVVIAAHSDQALRILESGSLGASDQERALLGSIHYQKNIALLHTDKSLMPKTRKAWASWNYLKTEEEGETSLCVTYWMNRLQNLNVSKDLFVTLNPTHQPAEGTILRSMVYSHPVFDSNALKAQSSLWELQGHNRTWFCGAYFGHGFHEDGLQSGLAVAEALGNVRRPWNVENESGRIPLLQAGVSATDRQAAE
ncbi:NAD(P)/FAD-dependent oxidoreductase [Pseudovibrio sp. SPO723]|uniref:NAD(P)/FAD-dependent oxidoreductase n=1 Tax=Nesiotobacter zosterae TaxID=392721 RepID=UPI0029C32E68|nr:FAD-dependent oxidoreductase [Pseudovibrio sp. SPO723]MDX5593235.1 FAD-dependent oxidoreductase [Pseudovibrio sp. SPO723]